MNKKILVFSLCIALLGGVFHKETEKTDARSAVNDIAAAMNVTGKKAETAGLIRFHVLANSDDGADQALKLAVRDRVLAEISPCLAQSGSLEESRALLTGLIPRMEEIGQDVVREWGMDYDVAVEFGMFPFPTKSYGSFVLPAGEYEAVKIVIGAGEGANWWCVLFPPLCFVSMDSGTAVRTDTVDLRDSGDKENTGASADAGKKTSAEANTKESGEINKKANKVNKKENREITKKADGEGKKKPKVRFWFWEKLKKFF